MRMLAPTLHYDFQLVNEMKDSQARFKAIEADVLLLGGSVSPNYLKTALDALSKVFPHAKRVEFAGLGHGASGPRAMAASRNLWHKHCASFSRVVKNLSSLTQALALTPLEKVRRCLPISQHVLASFFGRNHRQRSTVPVNSFRMPPGLV
jgi:hypothetical protein